MSVALNACCCIRTGHFALGIYTAGNSTRRQSGEKDS